MNKFIRSILKTAVYFLDQTDSVASDLHDRVSDTVDRAHERVSRTMNRAHDRAHDHVSSLRDQTEDLYEDHRLRHAIAFVAGVSVGVGTALLFAPASGEETRNSIGEKVQDIGDRVRTRFSSTVNDITGTEG